MAGWSAGPPGTPPAAQPGYPAGSPYGPYGPPGKGQRETGALLICVAVLVITIVVAFIAAVTIVDDADSSASPTRTGPYAPGGVAGTNGADGGGNAAAGGGASASPTGPSAASIRRNFPLYPGARRVTSGGPYLPPGAYVSSTAEYFVVAKGPDSVLRWYGKHLAADHLHFLSPPSRVGDSRTGQTVGYYTSITTSGEPYLSGNFNIERGRSGTRTVSVLSVRL